MEDNIKIKTITSVSDFEELRSSWDTLIECSPTQDVFLTWEWFYAWFRSYGKNAVIRIITVWKGNELVGVAPFMLIKQRKYGLTFRVLRTLSAPQTDVGGILVRNEDRQIIAQILEYIFSMKGEWDLIEFNQYYQDGIETQSIIQYIKSKGYAFHVTGNKHFYISYESGWDAYHATLSPRFRKNLRRSQRGMDELGKHAVERYTGSAVNWEIIEKIMEVNRHATFPLLCDSLEDQTLHKEMIALMADKGWVDIYLLTLDDKPIAYEYGFLYKGRLEDWRVGFDRRTDLRVSIGVYLTMQVMKTGCDENQKEIDFLRGDEGYKNDWKPVYREYLHIKAARKHNFLTTLSFIWLPKLKLFAQEKFKQREQTSTDE